MVRAKPRIGLGLLYGELRVLCKSAENLVRFLPQEIGY